MQTLFAAIFLQAMIGLGMALFAGGIAVLVLLARIVFILQRNRRHPDNRRSYGLPLFWLVVIVALMVLLCWANSGPQLIN